MNTLTSPDVAAVLHHLQAAAEHSETHPTPWTLPNSFSASSAQDRADALQADYMPVSRSGCHLLYALARASRPEVIVEFGASYGLSTLHLAAAVADNGTGHVYTTEMSAVKIAALQESLRRSGLDDVVTILPGDALETLKTVDGPIGMILLDGWKDLCLPVLRMLEKDLKPGALVIADDTTFESMADYLAYVQEAENGYVSVPFPVEDGMEISCRV
ncbi:O-methyltransferase [Kineosporia babensis]|uniref:Class I SAM-dependent methyltransferase n=1 Tax=Kineosporia babensis TaxID=499548 RepID=A0A9X1SYK2_9ACTN|nr:class I SAM-dependent methyltransferase [Kineosporia babensis]MCD5311098.1 class I SAM-dependent methyltransferase [Kineosporia babensis]